MEKYRYGTKEIAATITGAALIVYFRYLETYLTSSYASAQQLFVWASPRILVVAIAAVFFGPITGMICGLGGDLLIYVIFGTYAGYPEMVVLGTYGFLLGLYYGKMHYDPANFMPRSVLDFNAIQISLGIMSGVLLLPLIKFLSEDVSLYESIERGIKVAVGNSILVGTICPILMFIVFMVIQIKEKKNMSEEDYHD